MDWHSWIDQHIPFTEVVRGGSTVWPHGGKGLIGDSLGPIMHLHNGASEIFYFISGTCRLEIGNTEEIFGPGQFVLVPPEVPHNLWNGGDDDLLVFWLVAPNFIKNKWITENFPPDAMNGRAIRSEVRRGVNLPSDANIRSQIITLAPGATHSGRTAVGQEAVIYLVEGQADVKVSKLSGTLNPHDFAGVPVETDYTIAALGEEAMFVLFEMPGGQR